MFRRLVKVNMAAKFVHIITMKLLCDKLCDKRRDHTRRSLPVHIFPYKDRHYYKLHKQIELWCPAQVRRISKKTMQPKCIACALNAFRSQISSQNLLFCLAIFDEIIESRPNSTWIHNSLTWWKTEGKSSLWIDLYFKAERDRKFEFILHAKYAWQSR